MSITMDDVLREEAESAHAWGEAMDGLRDQFVADFKRDRLRSYYDANPEVFKKPVAALTMAHALRDATFVDASLVFAVSSAEQTVRDALLRPVVHGLVHNDAMASLVVESLAQGNDRVRKLLFPIAADIADIDLTSFTRIGAAKPLWEEYQLSRRLRNSIVHAGGTATQSEAANSIDVASSLLADVFKPVVAAIIS